MKTRIIVATARNRAIGKDNKLLWSLSKDLKRFKRITLDDGIIMGRKTFDSIGRPLPRRKNIVLSRKKDLSLEGAITLTSIDEALRYCHSQGINANIIGGAQIYSQTIEMADEILITRVNCSPDADTFFPEIDWNDWTQTFEEHHAADEKNEFSFSFCNYIAKQ